MNTYQFNGQGTRGYSKLILCLAALLLLVSCASEPMISATSHIDPLELLQNRHPGFEDGRARFREIFCTILHEHGGDLPDYMPCSEALVFTGEDLSSSGQPVNLGRSNGNLLVGLVPGLAWQCVRNWLDNDDSAVRHMAAFGFDIRLLEVDGLSSSRNNAQQIRQQLVGLSRGDRRRPIILIGFSKGIADILEAIVRYPELRGQIAAVVSVAGAVGGSLLADLANHSMVNLLAHLPGSDCESGDRGAIESLRPGNRNKWLSIHCLTAFATTRSSPFRNRTAYQWD